MSIHFRLVEEPVVMPGQRLHFTCEVAFAQIRGLVRVKCVGDSVSFSDADFAVWPAKVRGGLMLKTRKYADDLMADLRNRGEWQ